MMNDLLNIEIHGMNEWIVCKVEWKNIKINNNVKYINEK